MKIKQQKQIQKFLIQEFGRENGIKLFEKQENLLQKLIENTKDKSKNQMKTMVQTLLPRIALYKVFLNENTLQEKAYEYMRKYMIDFVAAKKHASMKKMEKVPGFYSIYSKIFLKYMRKTDLQESVQTKGKDYYDVTIHRCLWHTACVENECPELCRLFCDVDDISYGGLEKIGFSRTKTLGYGGDCCDFHFKKLNKREKHKDNSCDTFSDSLVEELID